MKCLLFLVLVLSPCRAMNKLSGSAYTALSAAQKQSLIWENVISSSTSNSWPGAKTAEIFLESMCPTLQQEGDEMPSTWIGGTRQKYIHSVGSVGKVEFVPEGSSGSYSGIFQQGAKYGIVRISLATEPKADELNTTPGMGLKFLRDGVESASLVAMYSVQGQESWNVFANDWSNHIPPASGPLLALASKFATGTPNIQQVGLSDFAMIGEDGAMVPTAEVNFPYKLVFRPTGSISFPDTYHGLFTDDLASIPEGSVLWKVYAWTAPAQLNGKEELIGSIVLRSSLVTSLYGDSKLFFRHQDMREDLALRPDWAKFTDRFAGGLIPTTCPIRNAVESVFNIFG